MSSIDTHFQVRTLHNRIGGRACNRYCRGGTQPTRDTGPPGREAFNSTVAFRDTGVARTGAVAEDGEAVWDVGCFGSLDYGVRRRGAQALVTRSPTRMVPASTTLVLMPRRQSWRPSPEFTQAMASMPKRSTNLAQPL